MVNCFSGSQQGGTEESTTLRWQQKVFSPREFQFYSQEANCRTPRELQYHRDVKRMLHEGWVGHTVEDDQF